MEESNHGDSRKFREHPAWKSTPNKVSPDFGRSNKIVNVNFCLFFRLLPGIIVLISILNDHTCLSFLLMNIHIKISYHHASNFLVSLDQSSKDSRTIASCWKEACSGPWHRHIDTYARGLETGAHSNVGAKTAKIWAERKTKPQERGNLCIFLKR